MRADAVLVVDDLGVGAVEADPGGRGDGERAVVGRRDVLHLAVLDPDDGVLPVVAVPADAAARYGGVVEVRGVAALPVEGAGRVEAAVDRAVGADGRRGVAAVRVVVEGRQIGVLGGFGVGGQRGGRGREGGAGEGHDERGGPDQSGDPSPAVCLERRRRHCVLLLVRAQPNGCCGKGGSASLVFMSTPRGWERHSGYGRPNSWISTRCQTRSSGRSAADSSGARSGRSRSQEGWRSSPARVRVL